jgi:hypothetical protein
VEEKIVTVYESASLVLNPPQKSTENAKGRTLYRKSRPSSILLRPLCRFVATIGWRIDGNKKITVHDLNDSVRKIPEN